MIFMFLPQFLGHTEVDQPKGTEVVRDAVRKLKVSYCSFTLAAHSRGFHLETGSGMSLERM